MRFRHCLPILGLIPTVVIVAQQTPAAPAAEQVYKDIEVFKGVPASDLIPAMEFMSASMKVPCTGCHKAEDYAAPTKDKTEARRMVLLQRDINNKWFNGRLEVTCMSCHNGKSHPTSFPIPTNVEVNHEPADDEVEPKVLFDKHAAAVGKVPEAITLTGTLQAPNDQTHERETTPLEVIQTKDGKFRVVSGARKFGSDGKQVWYYNFVVADEPAASLSRIGRSWRGENAFGGLDRVELDGQGAIGKTKAYIIRARRPSSGSIEDLYFDMKSGLLLRLVNIKRSTVGTVISSIDYSNYKTLEGVKVPTKVIVNSPNGDTWTMSIKSARASAKADDAIFRVGS